MRVLLLMMLATWVSPIVAHAQVPPAWVGLWGGATRNPPPGVPAPELPYEELEKAILTHLQPWALAKHDATEWNIDDTGQVCKPDGIFRAGHEGSGGFRFVEAPGKLYQLWSPDEHGLHRIYLASTHPKDLLPTWNGDARGHWEGDTLVVDIIGFNDKSWLGSDRQPHTEELHVVERYRLFGSGAYMELRVFVDDRKAFTSPYTYTRYYRKMPDGSETNESICNQSEADENLWRIRQEALLAEHASAFATYRKSFESLPLPAPTSSPAAGQAKVSVPAAISATLRQLAGIYAVVPFSTALPGGLKATGSLVDLPLQPSASAAAKALDLKNDAARNCQVIGPFRMMAREGTRLELLVGSDRLTMVFEDSALGNRREVYLWPRPEKVEPSWLGDSRGRWEGDTFVVETAGFNERTWLNDSGAPHSDQLQMVERYRLVLGGRYLELKVTASDPKTLARAYQYTRYYVRQDTELNQQFCQEIGD